ncbi:MAG: nucleotidyltransferase family protein [Eubacterium sp.]|nr:nucleotidyltransferase family protein [Eubacterium sp.]
MTVTEENFLTILKYCIHPGKNLPVLKEPVEWKEIMNTAAKQNLFPLIYDTAPQFSSFGEFEDKYFIPATKAITRQVNKTSAFLELYKAFLEEGFAPIVVKGIICRLLYGDKADLRPSGDEDILIEKKDFDRAAEILNCCRYTTKEKPDKKLAVVQEITFENPDNNLKIEMHLNPFGTADYKRIQMNDCFRNVFDSRETVNIEGVAVRVMEPADHMLFIIFHAFKHFISGGFGIRLMTDCLMFEEKYGSRIDRKYVWERLKKIGADTFYNDLLFIGNTYLGFHLSCDKKPTAPNELLEDMFQMGTFGNKNRRYIGATQFTTNAVNEAQKTNGSSARRDTNIYKIKVVFRRLFPSWKTW